MTNPVCYFEIPVRDLHLAADFYRKVFLLPEFEFAEVDGNEMAFFPLDPASHGASGALARGESYVPSVDGTRVYFRTDDLEATLARAVSAGGRELYPPTSIGPMGRVAEFADLDGNRIALHTLATPAGAAS